MQDPVAQCLGFGAGQVAVQGDEPQPGQQGRGGQGRGQPCGVDPEVKGGEPAEPAVFPCADPSPGVSRAAGVTFPCLRSSEADSETLSRATGVVQGCCGVSQVTCCGIELGHELPVGGAGGGQVLVAFFELQAQVNDLLLELSGLLL